MFQLRELRAFSKSIESNIPGMFYLFRLFVSNSLFAIKYDFYKKKKRHKHLICT